MLHPYEVHAPVAGAVHYRLKLGDYVNPGTLLARVGETEVRSPAPGEVRNLEHKEGDAVAQGDILAELSVDKNHVWEALRGLYVVGPAPGPGRCAALRAARAGIAGVRGSPGRAHRAGDSIARKVIDRPSAGGLAH